MTEKQQWYLVRDGLADLWDWWGEGVHLRYQPDFDQTTSAPTEFRPPLALEIAQRDRWLSKIGANDPLPVPTRTVTIDAHLGDGLFQLCADVHREIIGAQRADPELETPEQLPWDKATEPGEGPRRYQTAFLDGSPHVVFAPTGPKQEYLRFYMHRINATGYHSRGYSFAESRNLSRLDLRARLFLTLFELANLAESRLSRANLYRVGLFSASLCRADLSGADLSGADFCGADLAGARLTDTLVSREQLAEARNLEDAIGVDKIREPMPSRGRH